MSDLCYKTRNNIPERGMPKVYFCCHPKDFDTFFEDISNELFSRQNCSVWYRDKKSKDYSESFFEDLLQMHLIVIPITNRFLQKGNSALEIEFRFAIENSIPVLPLMQEQGLEKRFNELCGNIQYLDKFNDDSTCLEYTEKLDKFLSTVLVGDEMAEKIRSAFDAYVFLSYRKKDRKHAQALMKLIHQNEFCRDIAIWYDEFLVPGENFNSAIKDALQKCDLFVLTVTPNLVNETNYVMDIEFPLAKEINKPILPCEMVYTDKVVLKEKYENIPECTNGYDSTGLSESLGRYFLNIALNETKSSPEHLFFIGLAYLHGIDVEVDREKAVKLITDAAQQDLPDAISQLIGMYSNGVGVKPNIEKALFWRKKLLNVTEKLYEQNKTFSNAYAYIRACFELASADYYSDLYEEAITTSNQLKNICSSVILDSYYDAYELFVLKRHIALADLLLGQSFHANSNLDSAKGHYCLSETMFIELKKETDDPQLLRDIAILYNRIAQLCKVKSEYTDALNYYEKALIIQKNNASNYSEEEFSIDQVYTQIHISEIMRLMGEGEKATKCCLEALEILAGLNKLNKADKYISINMIVLLTLGESYRIRGCFTDALDTYSKLIKLEEKYSEQFGEDFTFVRAMRLAKTTQIYFQLGDYESAILYGDRAVELFENTSAITEEVIATGGSEQAALYIFVGLSYNIARNDNDKAIKYLKAGVSLAEEYLERGIICNIPDLIMAYSAYSDIVQMNGDLEEAEIFLKKAASIYHKYCSDEQDFRNDAAAFTLYMALGKYYTFQEKNENAKESLLEAQTLYNKLISVFPSAEESLFRDKAQLFYLLACCYIDDDNDSAAKEYYLNCIDAYNQLPVEQYTLNDWTMFGISLYQVYTLTKGFFKRKKWETRLLSAVYDFKKYYPSQYKQSAFYALLNGTGIFD